MTQGWFCFSWIRRKSSAWSIAEPRVEGYAVKSVIFEVEPYRSIEVEYY